MGRFQSDKILMEKNPLGQRALWVKISTFLKEFEKRRSGDGGGARKKPLLRKILLTGL